MLLPHKTLNLNNYTSSLCIWLISIFMSTVILANANQSNHFHLHYEQVNQQLQLTWNIDRGYALYQKNTHWTYQNKTTNTLIWDTPASLHPKQANSFIYTKMAKAYIKLPPTNSPAQGKLSFQGCKLDGQCMPPIHTNITFNQSSTTTTVLNFWGKLFAFYFAGLLASFSPCFLPLLPIILRSFAWQNQTKSNTSILGLSYALGTASCYAIIGALSASLSNNLFQISQNPYLISSISLLMISLVVFSNNQLITTNASFNKLSQFCQQLKINTPYQAAGLGAINTLLLTPCLTPILVAGISYSATTTSISAGTSILFSMGLGLITPILLLIMLGEKIIPKKQTWQPWVSLAINLGILFVSIHLLSGIVPKQYQVILWISLLIMQFILSYKHTKNHSIKHKYLILSITLILSIAFISNQAFIQTKSTSLMQAPKIHDLAKLKQSLEQAKINHQPTMIILHADWCTTCKQNAQLRHNHPEIEAAEAFWKIIYVDITQQNKNSKAINNALKTLGPPTILFFDSNGKELIKHRIIGLLDVDKTLEVLKINNRKNDQ